MKIIFDTEKWDNDCKLYPLPPPTAVRNLGKDLMNTNIQKKKKKHF